MALFLKNVAFHGILLDALFEEGNREWEEVSQLLREGIAAGVVQPLRTTVFARDQVEEAFRYMAQGRHIGKVLLQVRLLSGSAFPRCLCEDKRSFSCQFFYRYAQRNLPRLWRPPRSPCPPSAAPTALPPSPTSSLEAWVASAWSWPTG